MSEWLRTDVAIVGGGPSGLSAAMELRRRGLARVIVLEREPQAGGVPRHCAHPPFGMREFGRVLSGPEYARRLHSAAVRAGVDVRVRHSVVALNPGGTLTVSSPTGLVTVQARRVVLATGARETSRAARLVSGERPLGVMNTGTFQGCVSLKQLRPFMRPVIVGTELVSVSAILTCVRHGVRPAAIIEAADGPSARWPLGLVTRLLGIPVYLQSRITQINGSMQVRSVEVTSNAGRRRDIPCDGVIFSGEFLPESALLRMDGTVLVDSASGGASIDQFGRCTDPVYFAAGNALRPIETAGWCYREGRAVGTSVAQDLEAPWPALETALPLLCGAGIRFAVPQRIVPSRHASAFGHIQIRARSRSSGRLTVRYQGQILWSERRHFHPDRRYTIPLKDIRIPPGAASLSIAIESDPG